MNLPHPIRRLRLIRLTVTNIQLAAYKLLQVGLALFYAIQDNTAAHAELASVLKGIQLEAATTSKAVTYLAAIERHRQISAGQPSVFPEVIQ